MTDDELIATHYRIGFELATERVAAQAHCSLDEATDLMLECADADGSSMGDIALAVVEGRISFSP